MVKDGNVTGTYTGNRNYTGRCNFTGGVLGMGVQVVKNSQIWYVDKNSGLDSSGDGLSWDTAFLTITEAIAAAGDYDIVFVGHGIYNEATFPLTITQAGLKLIGAGSTGYNWGPCSLKSSASADTLIEVDASGVEICGLGFNCYTSGKSGIVVAASQSVYRTHIHDCFFGCAGAGGTEGECGIAIGCDETGAQSGDYDAVDTHVERCGFHYLAMGACVVFGTRTKINNCYINVSNGGSATGINFTAEGADRAPNMAVDNYLIGRNGGTGIKIASTEPTNGTLLVANNVVTYCTTNITQDKSNEGVVNNGTYGNGASPVIVDSMAAG